MLGQGARLEERQRQAETERGRSADDEGTPPDGEGKTKKGPKYKYQFGESLNRTPRTTLPIRKVGS